VGGGERLGHRRRQRPTSGAVLLPQTRHRPGEVSDVHDRDLLWQRDESREKAISLIGGESSDWCCELADDVWLSKGAAEPEQPETGRGECRRQAVEVVRPLAGEYISQHVVVDNHGGHYVVAKSGSSMVST
jgi:hypothetical protein